MFTGTTFYQMGFIATDLDRATERLARDHGIHRFRRKQTSPAMQAAHAWVGDVMVELIQVTAEANAVFQSNAPAAPEAIRLHHHGYRVADLDGWQALDRKIAEAGLSCPMMGSAMNDQLHFRYVDTRATLGIDSEYICLTGEALSMYDDVPRN